MQVAKATTKPLEIAKSLYVKGKDAGDLKSDKFPFY
jgi:hypothetical protein